MKPSDLVTSSSERQQEMRGLLRTEMTDAVNSGLVGSADKSASALKGASAVRKVAKGGASSAALAAVTHGDRDASVLTNVDGDDSDFIGFEHTSRHLGRSRSITATQQSADSAKRADVEPDASPSSPSSVGRMHRLGETLSYMGIHKVLEDTELEDVQDLYYKGKVAKKLFQRVSSYKVNHSSRKVVQSTKSARDDIFKKTRRGHDEERALASAQSRAQAASYGKKTVYDTAEKARETAAAKTAASTAVGTTSSSGGAMIAAGPVLLFAVIVFLLFIIIVGAAGQQSQQAGNGTLNATESQVAAYLMGKGLDEMHTAAVMGNMYAESGINPSSIESGGTGIGICQWSYGRANNLRRYAAQQGKSWDDLSVQLDFFWDHDIWSGEWSSSYIIRTHRVDGDPAVGERVSGSKSGFLATDDLADAVKQFCYGWERPGIPRINVRLEAAQRYYSALTTGGLIGGGEDYNSAEDWQKRIVNACGTTPWPGQSLCATWVSRVYANAGFPNVHGNGNSILSNSSSTSSDWSSIKVGQILSAQASPTPAGRIYGHTAIYIGGGQVMESVDSGVRTKSLSDWVAYYQQYGWVKYGWPW